MSCRFGQTFRKLSPTCRTTRHLGPKIGDSDIRQTQLSPQEQVAMPSSNSSTATDNIRSVYDTPTGMFDGSIAVPSSGSIKRSGPTGYLSSSHSTNDVSVSSTLTATSRAAQLMTSTMTATTTLMTTFLKTLTMTPMTKLVLSRSMMILTEFSGLVCKKKKISIDSDSDEFELAPDEDKEDEFIPADSESDFDSEEEKPMKTKGSLKKTTSSRELKKINDSKPLINPQKLPKAGPFVPLIDLVDTKSSKDDDKASSTTGKNHHHPFKQQKFDKAGPCVPFVDLVDTNTMRMMTKSPQRPQSILTLFQE